MPFHVSDAVSVDDFSAYGNNVNINSNANNKWDALWAADATWLGDGSNHAKPSTSPDSGMVNGSAITDPGREQVVIVEMSTLPTSGSGYLGIYVATTIAAGAPNPAYEVEYDRGSTQWLTIYEVSGGSFTDRGNLTTGAPTLANGDAIGVQTYMSAGSLVIEVYFRISGVWDSSPRLSWTDTSPVGTSSSKFGIECSANNAVRIDTVLAGAYVAGGTPITGTDSATGSDTVAAPAALSGTDSGAGTDAQVLGAKVTATDSAAGTDGASVSQSGAPTGTDSATGSDAVTVAVPVTISESATGTDTSQLSLVVAESATGSDPLSGVAALSITDSAAGTDSPIRTGSGSRDTIYQWYGGSGKSGVIDSYSRQLVRLPSGQVYAFIVDDWGHQQGSPQKDFLVALKADGVPIGASATEIGGHQLVPTAGDTFSTPDCRLDSSGNVHMVYQWWRNSDSQQQLLYARYNTNTDTWDVIGEVVTTSGLAFINHSWKRSYGAYALSLDSSGVPHVVYGTSGGNVVYKNRSGGTWSGATTVSSGTETGGGVHFQSLIGTDGIQRVVWATQETNTRIRYAERSGTTWTGPETVRVNTDSGGVWTVADFDQTPAIGVRPNGNSLVYWINGSHVQKISERTAAATYALNDVGFDTHAGSLYVANDDWYCFEGHQIPASGNLHPAYTYSLDQGGSWHSEIVFPPSGASTQDQDGSASVRYDPLNDNDPTIIDWLAWDEHNTDVSSDHFGVVYYVAVTPAKVSLSLSDSATGSSTLALAATGAVADSAAGTSTSAFSVAATVADSAAGTDTATEATAATVPDSATGSDSASFLGVFNAADTGGGIDSASVNTGTSGTVTELGLGTDGVGVVVSISFADAGSGTDTPITTVLPVIGDSATGSSTVAFSTIVLVTDLGVGTDSPTTYVPVTIDDSGLGTSTVQSPNVLVTVSDSGAGSSAHARTGFFTVGDSAVGTSTVGMITGLFVEGDEASWMLGAKQDGGNPLSVNMETVILRSKV